MKAVLAGMRDLLRRTLSETIDLRFELPCENLVMVDPTQLENAVLNLVLNARDAMPGGGSLILETSERTLDDGEMKFSEKIEPGRYCVIAVSDTGTGMNAETLSQVFDPFFTTKEFGKGSGLGLSMVLGFARQSGGHVAIDSELGVGTNVRLFLPLMADQEEMTAPEDLQAGLPLGQGQVVLVLEDEPLLLGTAVKLLQSLNYGALRAEDAAEALAVLDSDETVDLLFADVVLPGGLSGPELAAQARARRPDLKVLYCSGYAHAHEGVIDGPERLLDKPYSMETLAEALHEALDDR